MPEKQNIDEDLDLEELSVESVEDQKIEEEYLTSEEKKNVWVSVGVSFVLFTIILLPYGIITKKVINFKISPVILEYSELDLNLLSHNLLYDLMLEIPGTMNLKSDQAAYNLSYLTLLTGGASGSVQLVNPDMTFQGTKIKARTVNTEIDIDDIYNLKDSSGTFSFNASKMDVSNLNFRSIPIPINSVQISGVRINAVITKGNLKLDGSRVKADVFDIQFRGGMRLNRSFNATVFNLNVCINPVKGSNFEASDLFGFYVSAGGSSESGMCFLVTGSPASPSFVRQ